MAAAPVSVDEFLNLLRRSGLVAAPLLEAYLQLLRNKEIAPPTAIDFGRQMIADGLLTIFQAKQILQGRHRGFFIGKYRLLEPLGAGGMSHVFLAQHVNMAHRVAIKILPSNLARDQESLARFFQEARASAALQHPNIVRAHDIDREGDNYYIVMDFVDGVSLHDLVQRRGPLEHRRAATCVAQAAFGLQHIDDAGFVHRDIKPGNLLLDRAGMVRILDLGLARLRTGGKRAEQMAQFDKTNVLGTADYLAPEQALSNELVDIRADIYSLGATLYYLLAGQAPFEQQSTAQKLVSHQTATPAAPDAPEGLVAVLFKMLSKKREDRYQSPAEVAEALLEWTDPVLEPPADSDLPQLSRASQGPQSMRTSPPSFAGLGRGPGSSIRGELAAAAASGLGPSSTPSLISNGGSGRVEVRVAEGHASKVVLVLAVIAAFGLGAGAMALSRYVIGPHPPSSQGPVKQDESAAMTASRR
jgi:serine/threonine protein kinase